MSPPAFDLSLLDPDLPETTAPPLLAENSSSADQAITPDESAEPIGSPVKGQRKASHTSIAERDYRVQEVVTWILADRPKHQCKKAAASKWNIVARTFEDYYTLAFEQIRISRKVNIDEEIARSCAFYDNMMHDEDVDPKTRLDARVNKDKLLGLHRPKRIAMTDSNGDVVDPVSDGAVKGLSAAVDRLTVANVATMTNEQLQMLVKARQVLYASTNPIPARIGQGEGAVAQDGNRDSH